MSLVQGELEPGAAAEVEAHLAACEACAGELARLRATLELLERQPDLEPSEGFDAGFRLKLAQAQQAAEAAEARRASRWRLPALAAAGLAACAVIVAVAVTRVSGPRVERPVGDLELVQDLELLRNYDVVDNLDGLEDYDVVMSLDDLLREEGGEQ
jgi:anti-sigma factor RsiW